MQVNRKQAYKTEEYKWENVEKEEEEKPKIRV